MILTVWNPKGGVGKTTTAVTLAHLAALDGRRVLLIDADPQGSASSWVPTASEPGPRLEDYLGAATSRPPVYPTTWTPNLHLMPTSDALALCQSADLPGRFHRRVTPLARAYDLIVIDPPPSLSAITASVVRTAAGILVPVELSFLAALRAAVLGGKMEGLQQQNPALRLLGYVPIMRSGGLSADRTLAQLRASVSPVLTPVRGTIRVQEAPALRQPVQRCTAAEDYLAIWNSLRETIFSGDAHA